MTAWLELTGWLALIDLALAFAKVAAMLAVAIVVAVYLEWRIKP